MMNSLISIVIADDHPVLLNGLHNELLNFGYKISGTAFNGAEALNIILNTHPTIAILDIEMPGLSGFEVIKKAVEANSKTKFIILSYHSEKGYIIQAEKLKISAYLLKDEPIEVINKAIQEVVNGNTYYSNNLMEIYGNELQSDLRKISYLTASERTILRLISRKLNSKEISEQLSISIRTVQKHRTNIIDKLDLKSTVDALTQWTIENKELIETL